MRRPRSDGLHHAPPDPGIRPGGVRDRTMKFVTQQREQSTTMTCDDLREQPPRQVEADGKLPWRDLRRRNPEPS
jgi:hypothetical protein